MHHHSCDPLEGILASFAFNFRLYGFGSPYSLKGSAFTRGHNENHIEL